MPEVTKFLSGKYKCIASNVAGSDEKLFEIYVKGTKIYISSLLIKCFICNTNWYDLY